MFCDLLIDLVTIAFSIAAKCQTMASQQTKREKQILQCIATAQKCDGNNYSHDME